MRTRDSIPYYDPDAAFCNEAYVRGHFRDAVAGVDDPHFLAQLLALWAYLKAGPRPSDLVLVVFGLGYFCFVTDVIPDFTPFLGWMDDAMVVSAVVRVLGSNLIPHMD